MSETVQKMLANLLISTEAQTEKDAAECSIMRAEITRLNAAVNAANERAAAAEKRAVSANAQTDIAEARTAAALEVRDQALATLAKINNSEVLKAIGSLAKAVEDVKNRKPAPFDLVPERDGNNLLKRIAVIFK